MKYSINYQFMPIGASRPLDDGEIISIELNDMNNFGLIPNVGDYINIQNQEINSSVLTSGQVKSKYFNYIKNPIDTYCLINIVVQEIPDDEVWGRLIKE